MATSRKRFQPRLEALETRDLMAAWAPGLSVTQFGNTVTLTATSTNDTLIVKEVSGKIAVKLNGVEGDARIALSSFEKLVVNGGAGNDLITLAMGKTGKDIIVDGGDGNDIINGSEGSDWLFGGAGNDTLYGLGGYDYLFGEAGTNTLYEYNGKDELDLGYNDEGNLPHDVALKWQALDGKDGGLGKCLGMGSGDGTVEGYDFAGGTIFYNPTTKTTAALYGAIENKYQDLAKARTAFGASVQATLGHVLGDEQNVPGIKGARVSHFEGGSIYWSSSTGAHVVYGAILRKYQDSANLKDAYGTSVQSILGLPKGDEVSDGAGGRIQYFQGGAISWSPAGAHILYGAIGSKYADLNGVKGSLGRPVGDEYAVKGGGRAQVFEKGVITWQSGKGTSVFKGNFSAAKNDRQAAILAETLKTLDKLPNTLPSVNLDTNIDLTQSALSSKIRGILIKLAQGNEKDAGVKSLSVNPATGEVSGTFFVRHHHVVYKDNSGVLDAVTGTNEVGYDSTMYGRFTYNVYSNEIKGDVDVGRGIKLDLKDLISALKGDVTGLVTHAAGYQRQSDFGDQIATLRNKHGAANVWAATEGFVDWAGPETVARWVAGSIASAGSATPAIAAEVKANLYTEGKAIARWLQAKVGNIAEQLATAIVNAMVSRTDIVTPYFEVKWMTASYTYNSNLFPSIKSPPIKHLGYAIILKV